MSFACSNSQGGHFHLSTFQPMPHHTSQPSLWSGGEKSRLSIASSYALCFTYVINRSVIPLFLTVEQEAQDVVKDVRVEDPEENKTHQSRFAHASWADVPTISAHQKGLIQVRVHLHVELISSTSLDSDPLYATPIASYEAGRKGFDKFEDFDGQVLNTEVDMVDSGGRTDLHPAQNIYPDADSNTKYDPYLCFQSSY
ncbi:uncharacterized protein C8R40DRAFT_1075262 [Lentinula edodes]|uniref:uncharacterized protein n=1 Tax=Lentinula edodes TaxID=5353 RepID=UPI001E8CDCF2|nr:uncharacterized protein C8R40DRAFT_1075262 [Lentinula edodes]KAH7867906.1 hypothetical protein C8R40DRAFT_1075262 [Lentinula edodes]